MTSKQKWFTPIFDNTNDEPVQKRPRMQRSSSQNSFQTKRNDTQSPHSSLGEYTPPQITHTDYLSSNWIENFAPQSTADLAVHTKKVDEIRDWIQKWELNRNMLLINGSPGTGKTTTVRSLAKELGYDVKEWIVPVDVDLKRNNSDDGGDENTYLENQADRFFQFLFCSSRYASVFDNRRKRIVLVEDFPNIFINDAEKFNEVLEKYSIYGKSPLVFIVSDTKNNKLDIAYNLFGESVLESYKILKISFNGVSSSLLKKGLKRITSIMTSAGFSSLYKQPSTELIDSIIFTCNGDIRNAVINLHFASLKNASSVALQAVQTTSKTKGNKKNNKLRGLGCDDTITLMHALGRVLNPKYLDPPPISGINTLQHSPEQLASDFLSQPSKFLTLLHTNYVGHFQDIESVLMATDLMSRSDIYMNEWKDESMAEIGLTVAIRGIMVTNERPAPGWLPIKGRKKNNENKTTHFDQLKKFGLSSSGISSNVWASDYRTFVNIIKPRK